MRQPASSSSHFQFVICLPAWGVLWPTSDFHNVGISLSIKMHSAAIISKNFVINNLMFRCLTVYIVCADKVEVKHRNKSLILLRVPSRFPRIPWRTPVAPDPPPTGESVFWEVCAGPGQTTKGARGKKRSWGPLLSPRSPKPETNVFLVCDNLIQHKFNLKISPT